MRHVKIQWLIYWHGKTCEALHASIILSSKQEWNVMLSLWCSSLWNNVHAVKLARTCTHRSTSSSGSHELFLPSSSHSFYCVWWLGAQLALPSWSPPELWSLHQSLQRPGEEKGGWIWKAAVCCRALVRPWRRGACQMNFLLVISPLCFCHSVSPSFRIFQRSVCFS